MYVVLQCAAVLRCVAGEVLLVLQCAAVLWCVAGEVLLLHILFIFTVIYNALCCSVLQCVAVCCSV